MDTRLPKVIKAPPVSAIGKWILVRVADRIEKVGSIILPKGSYTRAEDFAVVVSVGRAIPTKKKEVPHDVKVGDTVMVIRIHEKTETQKAVQHVLGDGFLFLQENDMLCVIEDAPAVQIERDLEWAA